MEVIACNVLGLLSCDYNFKKEVHLKIKILSLST